MDENQIRLLEQLEGRAVWRHTAHATEDGIFYVMFEDYHVARDMMKVKFFDHGDVVILSHWRNLR